MKKLFALSLLLLTIVTISSCKKNEKKEAKPLEKGYSVDSKETTINWTAYKTTSKVPVKGQFTKVSIENNKKAATTLEALNGLKFTIPVTSIFTKDTIRDAKLIKYFFGSMKSTSEITGTIHIATETSGTVNLTMNEISKTLPITYTTKNQMVTINAIMDLNNWQAQVALETLNTACKVLHSGADGIAKTWSEVQIEVVTSLKYE